MPKNAQLQSRFNSEQVPTLGNKAPTESRQHVNKVTWQCKQTKDT